MIADYAMNNPPVEITIVNVGPILKPSAHHTYFSPLAQTNSELQNLKLKQDKIKSFPHHNPYMSLDFYLKRILFLKI